jgi:hypothetical protein
VTGLVPQVVGPGASGGHAAPVAVSGPASRTPPLEAPLELEPAPESELELEPAPEPEPELGRGPELDPDPDPDPELEPELDAGPELDPGAGAPELELAAGFDADDPELDDPCVVTGPEPELAPASATEPSVVVAGEPPLSEFAEHPYPGSPDAIIKRRAPPTLRTADRIGRYL